MIAAGRGEMRRQYLLALGFLVILVLCVYLPVRNYGFLIYDDNGYVSENRHVLAGIGRESVVWAFSDLRSTGNWHPLTWLSHMLDVQLFGPRPGAHHLVNLFFHAANAMLLFGLLRAMTGAWWRSLFVAALFAVHPLHVETVAWIAERKDVLSTCLGLLSLAGYLWYARRPVARRYAVVILLFTLSLMAKPMLVTLPVLCLLLDYWPLGRLAEGLPSRAATHHLEPAQAIRRRGVALSLLIEKVPLFAVSLAFAVVAYIAQARSASVTFLGAAAPSLRLVNAATAYLRYLAKTVWPVDLAVFYPYPMHMTPWWQAGAALAALSGISAFSYYTRRRFPFIFVGWLWFVVSLLPVIGLIQVGGQAMADRYTYVPLTGLFVIVAWSGSVFVGTNASRVRLAAGASTVLVVGLSTVAAAQVRLWADDVTLFRHTLAVTSDNYPIENNMGVALLNLGLTEEATTHLRNAIRINPAYGKAILNLGIALARSGSGREAQSSYEQLLRLEPDNAEAHYNLAVLLAGQRSLDEAVRHYREAIRINPALADGYTNLAEILIGRKNFGEAETLLAQALLLNPRDEIAHLNLGVLKQFRGDRAGAAAHYRTALTLRPDLEQARRNLEDLERR